MIPNIVPNVWHDHNVYEEVNESLVATSSCRDRGQQPC